LVGWTGEFRGGPVEGPDRRAHAERGHSLCNIRQSGLPLVAMPQLVRVYGQAMAQVADAEVRLFHLYVHEPLMRSGGSGRIGIHFGDALYRDGDYYGRDVNMAARVAARSAGGEVLVTRPVVEHAGSHLEFERIAEVRLKGFTESTEIFIAKQAEGD
jgi:adenylate cyclase